MVRLTMKTTDAEEHLKHILIELVEEHFPKGETQFRGRATVMMTKFYIEAIKTIDTLEALWQTK